MITLAVVATHPGLESEANTLAQRLELPLLPTATQAKFLEDPEALLLVSPSGLVVQLTGRSAPGPIAVEFGSGAMRHRRRAGQNELLGRAVGVGKKKTTLSVLDATAGMGKDAFVLADLGCHVNLCERHPIIGQLLASGLAGAQASGDDWLTQVSGRMQLYCGDAREMPSEQLSGIDVIYMDPMFPVRNKSASVKKEMVFFQRLLHTGEAAGGDDELLQWAMAQGVSRVVVKRPPKAPELAGGRKPSHVIAGKAVRYDVYVCGPLRDAI